MFSNKTGFTTGLFFAFLLVISPSAHATTFGPIPVVDQAAHSAYYVYGRVEGPGWAEMEERAKRPYTYWRVSVAEQLVGNSLGAEVIVRQPGGEIGDMGYRVAGSAELRAGEEVFLALRDTDEARGTKEIVGLASGKYNVEATTDGKKVVMSGLGIPVSGEGGSSLSPDEFKQVLRRFARGESSEADRNIFVTRNPTHEAGHADAGHAHASPSRNTPLTEAAATTRSPAATDEKNVQERQPSSEENSTGTPAFLWIVAAVLLLALLGALALVLKR